MDGRSLPSDPNSLLHGIFGRSMGGGRARRREHWLQGWWLADRLGHPHSAQLRLTERYRRRDFGHLSIEMTINDPDTYEKPFTYTQPTVLLPDTDLLEFYCTENERDAR